MYYFFWASTCALPHLWRRITPPSQTTLLYSTRIMLLSVPYLHDSLLQRVSFANPLWSLVPYLIRVTVTVPLLWTQFSLDSGAQGSNFLARQVYDQLPSHVKHLSRPINRVVWLGDSRSLAVNLEVPLTLAIPDSQGLHHQHLLWYSVLDVLSHDVIIGLIDLIGPYYDLFEDSVISSRKLATTISISNEVDSFTSEVNAFTSAMDPNVTLSHRTTVDRIFAREKV